METDTHRGRMPRTGSWNSGGARRYLLARDRPPAQHDLRAELSDCAFFQLLDHWKKIYRPWQRGGGCDSRREVRERPQHWSLFGFGCRWPRVRLGGPRRNLPVRSSDAKTGMAAPQ